MKKSEVPLLMLLQKAPAPSKARPGQSSALRAHMLAARSKMNTMSLVSKKKQKKKLENNKSETSKIRHIL